MSISHIDADQRAYGPPNEALHEKPVQYFINPIGIQSLILSATELGASTLLTTDALQAFSVNANLSTRAGSSSRISFPLVQGMGFVTGIYNDLQPAIHSSVFFRSVVMVGSPHEGVFKYRISLEDNKSWLLYAMSSNGNHPQLQLVSNTLIRGPTRWSGTIQIAKNTAGNAGESLYDKSAGVYATAATVTGSVNGTTGTYKIQWTKSAIVTGHSPPLVMFALPHHASSFDRATVSNVRPLRLQTTTKGLATVVVADSWTMVEKNLATDMGFSPWTPSTRSVNRLSKTAIEAINRVASSEIHQDVHAQSNLDSMYFSGKALSKFATLIYTVHELARQPDLAAQGLKNLKEAFTRFVENKQIWPLVYDTAWKGVLSSGTYETGNVGLDFGNTFYNDHHFHYGYFIHAAAVIGYLDASWLSQSNKDWVNMLVRDAANPSTQDNYFPFSRSFDWYHGHSWAKGIYETGDSKDEESSSEDAFFAYAMKVWGHVTGDASMEARGNLMLSIVTRSIQNYFLMQSDNPNQPQNFIANRVTGIVSASCKAKSCLRKPTDSRTRSSSRTR